MTGRTAYRVTRSTAREHFEGGGAVAVSDRGDDAFPIGPTTTLHTRDTTSWGELVELVTMWRNRYPGQRFYVVRDDDPTADAEATWVAVADEARAAERRLRDAEGALYAASAAVHAARRTRDAALIDVERARIELETVRVELTAANRERAAARRGCVHPLDCVTFREDGTAACECGTIRATDGRTWER